MGIGGSKRKNGGGTAGEPKANASVHSKHSATSAKGQQSAQPNDGNNTADDVAPASENVHVPAPAEPKDPEPQQMEQLMHMLTGRSADAERYFKMYDVDKDGFLSPTEVYRGLGTWNLNLKGDMYNQLIDCNFLYADRDLDGKLSLLEWTQLFKLMSEVARKFSKSDSDHDGMINKTDFINIVKELDLKLIPSMLKEYVDVNFKFVDRALRGKISFGQFLACYANFLYSYEISQGMRRRRQAQKEAEKTKLKSLSQHGISASDQIKSGRLDKADGDVLASVT